MTLIQKFTSRKFLLAVSTGLAGVLVALGKLTPEQSDALVKSVEVAAGALLAIAGTVAYIAGEAKIDAANKPADK